MYGDGKVKSVASQASGIVGADRRPGLAPRAGPGRLGSSSAAPTSTTLIAVTSSRVCGRTTWK